eukprot:scaffold1678_cov110-Isochrysis_galbana.AAC.1
MRPLGAVWARADKARDRHGRKCLEGSLNMTRGHTIKHRHLSPHAILQLRKQLLYLGDNAYA